MLPQIKSAVEAASGDMEAARRTQEHFGKNLETAVDGTPVLGHVKGAIHIAAGEKERGEEILKSSTRTAAVIAGGVVGGPGGAVAGGLIADGTISAVDGR